MEEGAWTSKNGRSKGYECVKQRKKIQQNENSEKPRALERLWRARTTKRQPGREVKGQEAKNIGPKNYRREKSIPLKFPEEEKLREPAQPQVVVLE